jgi:hypothetical protein
MKQESIHNNTWAALNSAITNNNSEQIASILSKEKITQRDLARALSLAFE